MAKLARWLGEIGAAPVPLLIATDYDGTLTKIVGDPAAAWLDGRARRVLQRLAAHTRVQIAILTGRALDDVSRRIEGVPAHWIAAEHGGITVDPDRRVHDERAPDVERLAIVRERAAEIARIFRGAFLEQKPSSVALHYRDVEPRKQEVLVEMFRIACAAHRADLLLGRRVAEARFARADKGAALARILAQQPRDVHFLYAGDDTTDEPALAIASMAQNGVGLYVRSTERPHCTARVTGVVDGPAAWLDVLEAVARALEGQVLHAS